jgi:NAD(P)-dependent dehydrogenase (short-subunit alcohol dehydrogenase family)
MKLAGKVAIVTGGGRGIGLGICRVLAKHGASIVIAQLDTSTADTAMARLEGADVLVCQVDVADRAQIEWMVEHSVQRFGRVDILVNNAAVTGKPATAPFLECSEASLDHIIDVNLKGVFHGSQVVARQMIAAGIRGSIVHVSSVGAFAAQEHASVYCATKAAVASLAQSMALELAQYGIRVNCVAPGDIRTEANADIVAELKADGATGKYLRVTPAGRRGSPEEIGNAVAFLASEEASFVTGTTLIVDGGFLSY